MATFRTGPDGRAVISDDNRVTVQAGDIDRGGFTARERAAGMNRIGERRETRISDGGASVSDPRRGYESMNAPTQAGTGYMSRSEFEALSGMTDTNPYGNDGYFTREHGIDPRKIDYTSNLGPRGIENVKRQAYHRFLNPFAQIDAFGRPTLGANAALGITRYGVQPGDLTRYGPAVQSQREGIAGLFENTMLGSLMPKQARIPGYDMNVLLPDLMGGPAVGGGTEPPGIPYFTSSTNPPLAPDAPSMEEIKAARDAGERSFGETDFETERRATDEDSPFSRGTVREIVPREIFTDDITVADVLAAEPVAGSVLVNPRPTVTTPETENQRIMREQQEAFDAAMRRRQQESSAFMDRTNETLDEILRKGDTTVTPGIRGGAIEPQVSEILSPENIAEILELPGRNPNAPFPVDIIPPSLLMSR
mgnify:FL=1